MFDPEASGAAYAIALRDFAKEFGMERVEKGVDKAITYGVLDDRGQRQRQYPPSIAQLREVIEGIIIGGKVSHPANCELCGGAMWVDVGNGRVKRCPNRTVVA